ncbi:putative leucine-rich repeat-containing protein DDB_G0290503 [Toxorhynchites rutilus septentrionalis]|uniref:putative leucine-rich repeat-containing protein DDB_G0290503 n=1 Tax=Toxorhynchites rutilus septentrionalis TaxID=329112 RepID=UPI0024799AD8|nr:putative leucine-rich repeat-containing protein DDB_G0290503 [Toxorhynchites rutilus septentrionalis]
MDYTEQGGDSNQGSEFDEVVHHADNRSSSGDSNDSESASRETSQKIVAELRTLLDCSKVEIVGELAKSRILQARYKKQVDILQLALENGSAEKAKLQLELAKNNKIIQCLQEAAQDLESAVNASTERYNTTVDMIAILDMKRVQLIKNVQAFRSELSEYHRKIDHMEKEVQKQTSIAKTESERNNKLQEQLRESLTTNTILRQELDKAQTLQKSLTSSHSAKLNEIEGHMNKLNNELNELQCRLASEVQKNAALKQTADTILAEKTQYSTEIVRLETKLNQTGQEMQTKLRECNAQWQTRYQDEINRANEKCVEANRKLQKMTSEMTKMEETVEKMTKEQSNKNQKYECDKNKIEELENKVGGMQTILEDRNKEIFSLHSKLNGEQKKFEDQKQQFQVKIDELQCRVERTSEELGEKNTTILQLQGKMSDNKEKMSSMGNQLKQKEEECNKLRNEASEAKKLQVKISQLESALAEHQTSKVATMEQQPRVIRNDKQSELSKSPLAQVTSTPLHSIDLNADQAAASAKKIRLSSENKEVTLPSDSNYSTFQSSVQRKRGSMRFFQHTMPSHLPQQTPQQQPQQQQANNVPNLFGPNNDFNLSLASTINIDDETLDVGNFSSGSSIRLVKPFFRRHQDA